MNKRFVLSIPIIMLFSLIMLAGCGKSEFGVIDNTENRMVINAENAEKDAYFIVGTLEAEEGQLIEAKADLKKGEVRVEIFTKPEGQNISELIETEGDVILKADLRTDEWASGTISAGSYMVKATCLETATGTVTVEVKPAP